MNTHFLITLCAIAEAGSVAAAARQLNLAPASVTEQMRSLQRELGAVLMTRQGRHTVLTRDGQEALDRARLILSQLDELRHAVRIGGMSGHFRVGAISTALISMMPDALRLMTERRGHPGQECETHPARRPARGVGLCRTGAGHLQRMAWIAKTGKMALPDSAARASGKCR